MVHPNLSLNMFRGTYIYELLQLIVWSDSNDYQVRDEAYTLYMCVHLTPTPLAPPHVRAHCSPPHTCVRCMMLPHVEASAPRTPHLRATLVTVRVHGSAGRIVKRTTRGRGCAPSATAPDHDHVVGMRRLVCGRATCRAGDRRARRPP